MNNTLLLHMKIIIVGGSVNGLTLANLIGENHEITIVESDEELAQKISSETHALVVHGDGGDISLLQEAGLAEADAIVTTADDKTNLMVCQIAKSEGKKKIIALVREPKNEELFIKLGVNDLVSSVGTNVTAIKRLLHRVGEERVLVQLGDGKAQIIELALGENSKLIGQQVSLPHAHVAFLYRSGEIMVPDESTLFEVADVLVVALKTEDLGEIFSLISGV
jgi:trk system potassium uptake protein